MISVFIGINEERSDSLDDDEPEATDRANYCDDE